MNRKLAVTVAAVIFCIAVGITAARFDLEHMEPAAVVSEPVQGIKKQPEEQPFRSVEKEELPGPASSDDELLYWLREFDGRLGVFVDGAEKPEMVLDLYLSSLPLSDQQALQVGICAGSYRQLISMIEDYIS